MEPLRKRPIARPVVRQSDLARIHILVKECGLTRDDHEQLVHTLSNGRTRSSGAMDHAERARYITHLDTLKRALGKGGPLPQWRKLRALWGALAEARLVDANSESAMNAWCARQLGERARSSARWYGNAELNELIESAKAWLRRNAAPLPRGRQ